MKLLLDTDIGSDIDDAVCLAYLLAQPDCELLGVTTVSGQPRLRAALTDAVCRAAGRTDVPIHAGTEQALIGPTPQPEVPQAIVLDRFDHRPPDDFAPNTVVEFLRDQILAAPGEVTLLTIGPLTNAALLFATYPDAAPQLYELVIMGGNYAPKTAVDAFSEWNISCDSEAAAITYNAAVGRHRSVGIDVTMRCRLPATKTIERFTAIGGALEVVAAATEVWATHAKQVVFHDPLAAVATFDPAVCAWTGGRVSVDLAGQPGRGTTAFTADDEGPHTVATDVDVDRFFDRYFSVFDSAR